MGWMKEKGDRRFWCGVCSGVVLTGVVVSCGLGRAGEVVVVVRGEAAAHAMHVHQLMACVLQCHLRHRLQMLSGSPGQTMQVSGFLRNGQALVVRLAQSSQRRCRPDLQVLCATLVQMSQWMSSSLSMVLGVRIAVRRRFGGGMEGGWIGGRSGSG